MKYKYFGYDPDSGFETFTTAKEAKEYAQDAIDWYRDHADEGWDEAVNSVCWGEIKQQTVMTDEKTIKEAEEDLGLILDTAICSGYADYGLEDM